MDLTTLIIGLAIGLIVGFLAAWAWVSATIKAKTQAQTSSESELKALLAIQAQTHVEASLNSIKFIEGELNTLRETVSKYEQSLQTPEDTSSTTTYFGEHASLFLRNTQHDVKSSLDSTGGAQPKDFANNGSGLFMGNDATNSIENKQTFSQEK